ncbi:MAG: ATP phosphoribosyltransferase [Pseudobdellovibrionaceae bacterium]|jgi:ATP phosphoribosyltransferase|nr:ATP phosphoribosyltransferase [Pseudobdellovibrionaceae bacterium]
MSDDVRLKLAIQKSGRLADDSRDLLERCGIRFTKSKDQLFCTAQDFPLDLFFVRDDDIPAFVASNVCQIGIVGQNVLSEERLSSRNQKLRSVEEILPLNFGKCRLSIAAPYDFKYAGPQSLQGKVIATSYAGLLSEFLQKNSVEAEIVEMQGAVEIAPRVGMADAICDLVSTGATLAVNGLQERDVVFKSQSILIKGLGLSEGQNQILSRLILRIQGVLEAQSSKYIMFHAPLASLDDICSVIPGSDAPTVLELQGRADKVAVHAVCNEAVFWETMEELRARGASDMLVVPIEKMLA